MLGDDMEHFTPLGGLQEGEEWIARLEREQAMIELDIFNSQDTLSSVGMGALVFTLDKTKRAIEEIKLEMMMLNE